MLVGLYQVLISTSVAEEGIDIPSVDQVILYEPVPSEIRMIQRRGRTGRKTEGQMTVLITKGTRDEAYYYSSIHKERKMKNQLIRDYPQKDITIQPPDQTKITDMEEEEDTKIPPLSVNDANDQLQEKNEVKPPIIYVDHRESKSGEIQFF